METEKVQKAAEAIDEAKNVIVFAGSGLSQESGIPTFRGENGLYSDPKVASYTRAETFTKTPEKVLAWYQKRRDFLDEVEPNAGHRALTGISKAVDSFEVATQNVDDLLERAFDEAGLSANVWHLHGELANVDCWSCDYSIRDRHFDLSKMPECPDCGSRLRPGVVWFGEALPQEAFRRAKEAAEEADVCLILGTSGMVYPAAHVPESARQVGATLIEVNPNKSELSRQCDICLRAKTGEALPEVERCLT